MKLCQRSSWNEGSFCPSNGCHFCETDQLQGKCYFANLASCRRIVKLTYFRVKSGTHNFYQGFIWFTIISVCIVPFDPDLLTDGTIYMYVILAVILRSIIIIP